jgi:hypothetical protein
MNPPRPIEQARSADLRGSAPALHRAAARARQIAAQTGTAVVVVRNGSVQHLYPVQTTPTVHGVPEPQTSRAKPT